MDLQSILTDFLHYLYEKDIDIRDEKYDWQFLTKDFIKNSGHGKMTKAELKRALELINAEKINLVGHKGVEKEHGFVTNATINEIPLKRR